MVKNIIIWLLILVIIWLSIFIFVNLKQENVLEKQNIWTLNQEKCFKLAKDFKLKENENIEEVIYSKSQNWCYIVTKLDWKAENWQDNSTNFIYNMLNYKYQASYSHYDIYWENTTKWFDEQLYIEFYDSIKN